MKNSRYITPSQSLYPRPLQTPYEGELWEWASQKRKTALAQREESEPKRSFLEDRTKWFAKLLLR